jgi:hypothetical protein
MLPVEFDLAFSSITDEAVPTLAYVSHEAVGAAEEEAPAAVVYGTVISLWHVKFMEDRSR